MRRSLFVWFGFLLVSPILMQAQSGSCIESVINQVITPLADDGSAYKTPYGQVFGQSSISDIRPGRTNIKYSWVGEHRIVSSTSADMAYEYGTLDISYDSNNDGKRREFKAVILNVYKAGKDGVCRKVAGTREPLPDQEN